ncbi:MAG: hypothetical protein ACRDRH_09020 [Pseudonocardia sp.]
MPQLQYAAGLVGYVHRQLGLPIASTALLGKISDRFTAGIRRYARDHGVPMVDFVRGQRKGDVMHEHLVSFTAEEGVLFIGRAQEKNSVFRTEKRRNAEGRAYPWIVRSTGVINQFSVYAVDADFGPFFLKFSSYFPYNAKLCINGHEWAKRQAAKEGIGFTALDNGFAAVDDVTAVQEICDRLGPAQIDALLRKWLAIQHPRLRHRETAGNLPALREIGISANRRLLRVQRLSHNPIRAAQAFTAVNDPLITDTGTRIPGLRFTDRRAQALLHTLLMFRLLPHGFANRDLRTLLAPLLGLAPGTITAGQMSDDLRRLRGHGLITRVPGSHRYRVTDTGLHHAMLLTHIHTRLLRPGLAALTDPDPPQPTQLRTAAHNYQRALNQLTQEAGFAA